MTELSDLVIIYSAVGALNFLAVVKLGQYYNAIKQLKANPQKIEEYEERYNKWGKKSIAGFIATHFGYPGRKCAYEKIRRDYDKR